MSSGALLGLHALTSVHWGVGTSLGALDLPIQRERSTGWPIGAGSAIKGVLRDTVREHFLQSKGYKSREDADESLEVRNIFGSAKKAGASGEDSTAGALSVTDARLVAMPVKSLKGVFAWVTCPAVIERLARDLEVLGITGFNNPGSFNLNDQRAVVTSTSTLQITRGQIQHLLLDSECLDVDSSVNGDNLASWIADNLLPQSDVYRTTRERLKRQLVVVSDELYTYFVKFSTEVFARIGLDYETKIVRDGALFYQECLPVESILYSNLLVSHTKALRGWTSTQVFDVIGEVVKESSTIQFGSSDTTGKGMCSVTLRKTSL
jgi:CRISPR-associated protein Cmr4